MTKLSSKYKTGEVAAALVMDYFRNYSVKAESYEALAAHLIKHLTDNNFVIAPRPYAKPARRGKGNTEPAPYTGPDMIGKSHSARLAGQ